MPKKRNRSIPGRFAKLIENGWYVWIFVNHDGSEFARRNDGKRWPIQPYEYEVVEGEENDENLS